MMERLASMADLICWLSILGLIYWKVAAYLYYKLDEEKDPVQESEEDLSGFG